MRTNPFDPRCSTALPEGMARSLRWRSPRWGISAANRTGAGMDLAAVWNGARVSSRGAPMSAAISKPVLSPNLQPARPRAFPGSRSVGCGKTTATSRAPATSSSLTWMMEVKTGNPTMWVLWRRSRMAVSTP